MHFNATKKNKLLGKYFGNIWRKQICAVISITTTALILCCDGKHANGKQYVIKTYTELRANVDVLVCYYTSNGIMQILIVY